MYAVVGCRECDSLWIVETSPETTQCPSCRTRYAFDQLRRLAETDTLEGARDARTRLLAERTESDDAASELPSFATMEADAVNAGPSEEVYLAGSGIDPERVQPAIDSSDSPSSSDQEVVREAIESTEPPTESRIIEYAFERGVSRASSRAWLDKLVRSGEVSVTDGRYRLL